VLLEGMPGLAKTLLVTLARHRPGRPVRAHAIHARPAAERCRRHA
jgi:MoxR-like ATPase